MTQLTLKTHSPEPIHTERGMKNKLKALNLIETIRLKLQLELHNYAGEQLRQSWAYINLGCRAPLGLNQGRLLFYFFSITG